jgi:hypothetical protein
VPLFVVTAQRLVNHLTNVAPYTPPTTAYAFLLRAIPDGHETGSQIAALELTTADYGRKLVDWDDTLWSAADDDGIADQLLDILFADSPNGYDEPFSCLGFATDNTGGDDDEGLFYQPLPQSLTPPPDSTPTIGVNVDRLRLGLTTSA